MLFPVKWPIHAPASAHISKFLSITSFDWHIAELIYGKHICFIPSAYDILFLKNTNFSSR